MDTDAYRALLADSMTERQLQDAVRRAAAETGWLHYHPYDSRRSEPGWPDSVFVKGDRILYRELKAAKGRLTPAQRQWLDALAIAGQDVAVWRPEHSVSGHIYRVLAGAEDALRLDPGAVLKGKH
jgi:hypothetical protein